MRKCFVQKLTEDKHFMHLMNRPVVHKNLFLKSTTRLFLLNFAIKDIPPEESLQCVVIPPRLLTSGIHRSTLSGLCTQILFNKSH